MKRIIGLMLAALLLCGCTARPQDETTTFPAQTDATLAMPTEPAGLYEKDSDLELRTDGAVRSYYLKIPDCYGMRAMGGDLLLFSGEERTTLTRLTGENLFTVASTELNCLLSPEDTAFQISPNGITYFDYASREVVFLDNDLKEVSRLGMPEDMTGKPILSSNRMRIFYCTADAVRIYDLETELDRLLRSVSYPQQSVEDTLLNDSVLRCRMLDAQGMEYTMFLSAETGEMLGQTSRDIRISAGRDTFYAIVPEGSMELILFGDDRERTSVLSPREPEAAVWFFEEKHTLLTACGGELCGTVDYYDLESGLRTASAELPGSLDIWYAEADTGSGLIYLMGWDADAGEQILCGWQPEKSPVEDDTSYVGPRYTLEEPDTAGLEECRNYADALSQTHGIQILIGQEAVQEQPWDYVLAAEYQVPVILRELQKLESCLQNFPEGFFAQLYGKPRICLVRSITGNAQSGSLEAASGLQFWQGEEEYVALTAGDTLEYAFYHELFHVIDGKVLSDSAAYYSWNQLNPKGFSYFQDYTGYMGADLSDYLRDDTRAFIDAYSASFPKEDRARIMEYACTADNAHYFRSETMQNKLRTLCRGIREAFHLEYSEEVFLWEQYLNEPLTP